METIKSKIYSFSSKIEDADITKKAKNVLIKNGILDLDALTNFTKAEIKALKGMGRLDIASLELFLKKVGLIFKKEEKKEKERDVFLEDKRKLVFRLLKNTENINWANEIRAANTLFKQFPNSDFWNKFTLPFKLNSLFFLLSAKGKEFIYEAKKEKKEIVTFKKVDIKLSEEIIGENIISAKPKSIKDFLNGK